MSSNDSIKTVFFALLRAGLWEQEVRLASFGPIDFSALYALADEQSVVGLIAAGLEHVTDRKVLKHEALPFMKKVFCLEGRNTAMNEFISKLIEKMRSVGIYALLVKGQGIAQCYARPQWRSAGDIDLLLDESNYSSAKTYLLPLAESSEQEGYYVQHYGMEIDSWVVELHGTLRTGLSFGIDRVIDAVQENLFSKGCVRTWRNGETDVFLPGVDNDIIFIFTHFLKHFYRGGIGLRQICDWCRLLWTYKDTIDRELLNERILSMRLMSEWKAFAAYVVEYLGMPTDAVPFYDSSARWIRKASRIQHFIMKVGNFGHNRDQSYFQKYPYVIRKTVSLCRRLGDLTRHAFIFPFDSFRFLPSILFNGLRSAARGE